MTIIQFYTELSQKLEAYRIDACLTNYKSLDELVIKATESGLKVKVDINALTKIALEGEFDRLIFKN
jgi:ferritin